MVREINGLTFTQASWLEAQVKKMNSRAKRLKMEPLSLELLQENSKDPFARGNITAKLTGETPVVNGHVLVAHLENKNGFTVIREMKGQECPAEYQNADIRRCDHCKVDRMRYVSYVIRNVSTGKVFQVGSTCVNSFCDTTKAEDLLNWASFFTIDVSDMGEGDGYGGGWGPIKMSLQSVLYLATSLIKDFGFTSRSRAQETGQDSTADTIRTLLTSPRAEKLWKEMYAKFKEKNPPTPEEIQAETDYALDYWRNMPEAEARKSNFNWNLWVLAKGDYVAYDEVGYVAYIPEFMRRMKEEEAKQEARGRLEDKKHIGKVGEKITVSLRFLKMIAFEGVYGYTYLHIFNDLEGNEFQWKASSNQQMKEGQVYELKGTVKEHKKFNQIPQTCLTRCKVLTPV